MTISEEIGKKLGALVDGELSYESAPDALAQVKQNRELRSRWEQYHLVSDVLRNRELLPAQIDLSSELSRRVSQAIDSEPAIFAPNNISRPRQFINGIAKQLTGFAVAASVTVVVVLGVQYQGEGVPGTPQMATVVPSLSAPASQVAPVDNRSIPAHQFNKYLVNHNEHVGSTAMRQGVLPYARIVDGAKPADR